MARAYLRIVAAVLCIFSLSVSQSWAYWIWTPDSKKFINPKYAVKDSPKEQYEWAMGFYEAKDYKRAAAEFEKLTKNYEYSEHASKSQYYVGLSNEQMGKYYIAFQCYQKALDNFPHIDNIDEIIARQFNIGNIYMTRSGPSILGADIMTTLDRAIEIYKKVVENAPFGKLAAEAQFRLGEALKRAQRYEEAIDAFQKVIDDHPGSSYIDRARYEVAGCAYKASLKSDYDSAPTDKAIRAFQDFAAANKDSDLSHEADETVQRLRDKVAEKSYRAAKFYESQKKYESAVIYYREVMTKYPDSTFATEAKSKIAELSGKKNAGK